MLNHVQYQIQHFSVKYGIETCVVKYTAESAFTKSSINFDFEVAIITPGGAPGVFNEQVVQASRFIIAVTHSEYGMVYVVKVLTVIKSSGRAIISIDNTASVRMNVVVVSSYSDDYRLLFNGCLNILCPVIPSGYPLLTD